MAEGIIIAGIVVVMAQIGLEYFVNEVIRIMDIILLILLVLAFYA